MKMTRKNFTSGVIAKSQCDPGKKQTIFYDAKTPGLGLRVTSSGAKSYIFESRLNGKTVRLTIGDAKSWPLGKAQTEATKLKVLIDQGIDPRQVKADQKAAAKAAVEAKKAQEARETVTVGQAWGEYVDTMKSTWGKLHLHDHMRAMQAGGEKRARSKKLTEPGTLASLATIRLVDLTNERLIAWAKIEGAKRPARARNARTLLSTFLNWCISHPIYGAIITSNPAQDKEIKKYLGNPATKKDALQREQLPAWFSAVKQIQNPVISAYLQTLLLTGRRREEIAGLRWEDIDFQWDSLSVRDKNSVRDKTEGTQIIPLTPYLKHLLSNLPRRNQWVFSSPTAKNGQLQEPTKQHNKACAIAGVNLTIHGLRRSLASLTEWIEMPEGIAAQIQGHKPSGVREKHYIRRPLDLLRMWHVKIEKWILDQAGIEFIPTQAGLQVVK